MDALDTTELMPAHASRLLALSPDLLGACDFDGRVSLHSPAWERTLARPGDAITGAAFRDLLHPEDRDEVAAALDALAAGGPAASFTARMGRPDGDHAWVLWSAQASPEDGCVYLAGKDITERMKLEDELHHRAQGLERANAELQEFAFIASHDLAEPLRMITSYLELLQRRYGGQLDETADEFIGFAVGGAERMRKLIDDLLAYSRVGSHELDRAAVDLAELVGHVLRALGPAIEESGAEVEVPDVLPAVHADPTQLGQLLQNLLANAVKFRAPDRPPRVRIGAEHDDGGVRLTVADNGIGIPDAHRDRIFKMFARLHGRDEYDGTGIGLALCRRIADRHGGRIWVESQLGDGSAFHVWIPAA